MLVLTFFESQELGTTLSSIGWLDILLAVVFTWGIIVGFMRGLSHQLPRFIALIGTVVITIHYYEPLSAVVVGHSSLSPEIVKIITFFLICVLSNLILKVLLAIMMRMGSLQFVYVLERVVGGLVGGLRFIIIFSLISFFINMFSMPVIERLYIEESLLGERLLLVCPFMHDYVVRLFAATYNGLFPKTVESPSPLPA